MRNALGRLAVLGVVVVAQACAIGATSSAAP